MGENILSVEDLKFLEDLYFKNGIESLRFDDKGLKLNNENWQLLNNKTRVNCRIQFGLFAIKYNQIKAN